MNDNEIRDFILEHVRVTEQRIMIAKRFILKYARSHAGAVIWTSALVKEFLSHQSVPEQSTVVWSQLTGDPMAVLEPVCESLTWQVAVCEAIWRLIHASAILTMCSEVSNGVNNRINYTTVESRVSSSWEVSQLGIQIPERIRLAPSSHCAEYQPLIDGDLYLREIGIPDMHTEVQAALTDAVSCFKHELYTPCLVMLATALEGAWLELGTCLLNVEQALGLSQGTKPAKDLRNPRVSIAVKVVQVVALYEQGDLKSVRERSGIACDYLRQAKSWSDVVRDSRNAVHYGTMPIVTNCYEKVAALLLGAPAYLRMLYQIQSACQSIIDDAATSP